MSLWRFALAGMAMVAAAQQQTGKSVNFYSVDKEIALGKALAREVEANNPPLNDAAASAYVNRVARELAARIPDSPFQYVVTVVKGDSSAEPLTLPGGHIYVSTALFTTAQDESEFAGSLADAMAYAANRAVTRLLSRAQIAQIAALPLQFMDGWQGYAIRNGTGLAIPQGFEQFRRALHLDADALAVKMMAAAGYYPSGLAQYVERSGRNDGFAGWDAFQRQRLAAIRQASASATIAPSSDGVEFARVRDSLRK